MPWFGLRPLRTVETRRGPDRLPSTADAPALFSERVRHRWALWWGRPFSWRDAHAYGDALHRVRERFTFRSRNDPDATWKCCAYWQRTLVNKWNSREFVQQHGGRVPALYWHGRRIAAIPFATLPARYVIRPVWGASRRGVHVIVNERELLRNEPAAPAELRRRLFREHGPFASTPLLIEEFIAPDAVGHSMPIEYKCHTFAGSIAAIEMVERTASHRGRRQYWTPRWEAFADVMDPSYPPTTTRTPPSGLDEMLAAATRLSQAIGTYMRIDYFCDGTGPVFNEFSSTPFVRKPPYTPYCDQWFGALWQEHCAEAT